MDSHVKRGPFPTEGAAQACLTQEPAVAAEEGVRLVAAQKALWGDGGQRTRGR